MATQPGVGPQPSTTSLGHRRHICCPLLQEQQLAPFPPVCMAGGQCIAGHARVSRPLGWVGAQALIQLLLCAAGQGEMEG